MTKTLSIILIFLTVLLQTTLLDFFVIKGIKPEFTIILIVYYALFQGTKSSIVVGGILGLLQDILSGGLLGLNLITKSLTGYIFGLISNKMVVLNPFNQSFIAFTATLVDGILAFFIIKVAPISAPGAKIFFNMLLPQAGYNSLICIMLIPLLSKLSKRYSVKKKRI